MTSPLPPRTEDFSQLTPYLEQTGQWIRTEALCRLEDQPHGEHLYPLMRDYLQRGGKGFRPALVLMCCEWFQGSPEQAVPSAVALELFHNFALVHDDIEDSSLFRRGLPTLHQLHGIPLALNAGDALLNVVHETLLENFEHLPLALAVRLQRHFHLVMRRTFEGQSMDIAWVHQNRIPTREEYEAMIERKTGWYSGTGPCQAGAMIAETAEPLLEQVGRLGRAIGIGFQMRDDLLNLTESSTHEAPQGGGGGYGKEQGGDFAEGKRTLIVLEMLERLPKAEVERLQHLLLASPETSASEEIRWAIEQAEQCGALQAVYETCEARAHEAQQLLDALPPHQVRNLLAELISYLAQERRV